MFDKVRIDHFRGLIAYWAVPYGETTAQNGTWIDVPYEKFFAALKENFPSMPFWAENLGIITPDVEELRKKNGFARNVSFAFCFWKSCR